MLLLLLLLLLILKRNVLINIYSVLEKEKIKERIFNSHSNSNSKSSNSNSNVVNNSGTISSLTEERSSGISAVTSKDIKKGNGIFLPFVGNKSKSY